jgi:thiosulfate/3-mercaptopyruvate sulfurtransferase
MAASFGPTASVSWLREQLGEPDLVVVDARPVLAYQHGHIPGSRHSDLYALKLADSGEATVSAWLERMQGELRRLGIREGDRVVFYEEISGTSAARGVWMMDVLGLGKGALLDGGLTEWRRTGGPISREPARPIPSDVTVSPRLDLLATADELRAAIAAPNPPLRLLDTRASQEWHAGTIPSSIHLEWIEALNPDGTIRPLEELRDLVADGGIDPGDDRPVVTFCASGYRAAHSYVVLKALGIPAKNYAPSWGEWHRHDDLPVAVPATGVEGEEE